LHPIDHTHLRPTSPTTRQTLWKAGSVTLHGVQQDLKTLAGDLVYEEDLMIGDLTVREVFNTSLCLNAGQLTAADRRSRVESTAKKLGLDQVLDNVIGTVLRRGLSGGQKRRCSVGVELIEPPTVLFIDEPTSGLDATAAFGLMDYMRTLARNSSGRVGIVVSLQQPNMRLLGLTDHLLLLGQGGSLYFGTLDESVAYFAALGLMVPADETPTDFYLRVTDSSAPESQHINFLEAYRVGFGDGGDGCCCVTGIHNG